MCANICREFSEARGVQFFDTAEGFRASIASSESYDHGLPTPPLPGILVHMDIEADRRTDRHFFSHHRDPMWLKADAKRLE